MYEVNIIKVDNKRIKEHTYDNTARAFNYFVDLFMHYMFNHRIFPKDDYIIQIDERNTKTNAKSSLEDYSATEFCLKSEKANSVLVKYCDSCNNLLIQLSDFFANLYYSYLMSSSAYMEIMKTIKEKVLKKEFCFPVIKGEVNDE